MERGRQGMRTVFVYVTQPPRHLKRLHVEWCLYMRILLSMNAAMGISRLILELILCQCMPISDVGALYTKGCYVVDIKL
jgi:hypothetical protein